MENSKKTCIHWFLSMLLSGILFSCQSITDSRSLVAYIQDESNGLTVSKTEKDIVYKLSYRPTEQLVLQECMARNNTHPSVVDSIRKVYSQYDYYTLSLSAQGNDLSRNALSVQLLSELAFHMDQLAFMTVGQDTLHVVDYNYSRLYGMTKNTSILLCFEKKADSRDNDRCLHVSPVAGITSLMELCITQESIASLPSIDLSKELNTIQNYATIKE